MLRLALVAVLFLGVGCGKDKPAAPPPAAEGGSIGVKPCDDYLSKMERCVAKLSPESQEALRAGMEKSRNAWRTSAGTADGKKTLEVACQQALDAAKKAAESMGCEW